MRTTSHAQRRSSLLLVAGLGLAAASCGSDDKPAAQSSGGADAKVTITVGCEPPKSNPKERTGWEEDVAAFQKLHPNITIESKDAFPCINPDTFQAKLAGGTQEDVFYVYYTDVQKIIKAKQAADISQYVGSVKALNDVRAGRQGRLQGRRQDATACRATTTTWAWSTTASCSPRPGSNPDYPAEDLGRGAGGREEDRRDRPGLHRLR